LTFATFFLWFGPAILLVAGFVIVRRVMVSSQAQQGTETTLSTDEQERLSRLLGDKQD